MLMASANFKGGQGKSTWAAILATWLGDQVEILDLDFGQGDSLAWAKRAGRPARLVRPEDCVSVLKEAAVSPDWFVVDCPPHERRETRLALEVAAMVVIPVVPGGIQDASAWGRMRDAITEARRANPGLKAAAVLNATRPTGISREFLTMLQEWHAPKQGFAVMGAVPQHVAMAEAYGEGRAPSGPSIEAVLAKLETFAAM